MTAHGRSLWWSAVLVRRFNIPTDRAHYDKVKIGDRINVKYREGKYTGTVWGAKIED